MRVVVVVVLLLLPRLKIPRRPPPHPHHLHHQRAHHHARAHGRARVHVPRPLLRGPQRILQHGMQPRAPRQERRRPRDPRVKLVVQRARAQHAHGNAGQRRGEHEARVDAAGGVQQLVGLLLLGEEDEAGGRGEGRGAVALLRLRGAEPARRGEGGEGEDVEGEEGDGEGGGEEGGFGDEAPVDGPFVEEDARELEGAGEVGAGVGLDEGEADE